MLETMIRSLSALLLISLFACTTNPVSGREEIVLMSEEREQEIGDEGSVQVEAQIGVVQNEALSDYVDAIGQKLASYSPRRDVEYSFRVVEMPEPNAFALPGGYIYISRGLLTLANSEAEIANVIGHEIGHVAARHAAQRDTVQKAATLLSVLGIAAAAATSGDGRAIAATQYLGMGLVASYTRGQETESDRIAMELTSAAGIDPGGMARFLKQLDNSTRLSTGSSRAAGFFDSHPATPERFAEATTAAQVVRWSPGFAIAPTQREFFERIEGLVVGPAAAEGVFRENIFMHADLGFAQRFPPGWEQHNLRDSVVAVAPRNEAIAVLELAGAGDDPRAMAVEYARQNQVVLSDTAPIRIGNYRAFRARARLRQGPGFFDAWITWVAFKGQIFQLSAGTQSGGFPKFDGILRSFARGFRELRPEERGEIDELRLRIVEAQPGDTLGTLSLREGNDWSLNETAVSNALRVGDRISGGQLIKIARREVYAPAKATPDIPQIGGPVQGPQLPPREAR